MSTALLDSIGSILEHYSDVIEGGNAYASGTSFAGIPGTYSLEQRLVGNAEDERIIATANGTTTTVSAAVGAPSRWTSSYWVRTSSQPCLFLVCTAGTTANVGAGRRITAYASGVFTTPAWPAATTDGDIFYVREGFKRVPNGIDIDAGDGSGFAGGFDRFFHLSASPGRELDFYGSGKATMTTTLDVKLRLRKAARARDTVASALQNASIISNALARPAYRDGTYVRAVLPSENGPQIEDEDTSKVIVVDRLRLDYWINTQIL